MPPTGLEPVRCERGIFLLLYVTIATFLRCSLDYVLAISYDLGCWYIVSTHLFFKALFLPLYVSVKAWQLGHK